MDEVNEQLCYCWLFEEQCLRCAAVVSCTHGFDIVIFWQPERDLLLIASTLWQSLCSAVANRRVISAIFLSDCSSVVYSESLAFQFSSLVVAISTFQQELDLHSHDFVLIYFLFYYYFSCKLAFKIYCSMLRTAFYKSVVYTRSGIFSLRQQLVQLIDD